MRKLLWLILLLSFSVCTQAGVIDAYRRQTSGVFGLKGGVINGGHIRIEQTRETNIGTTAQAFFDLPIRRSLFVTAAFDLYDFRFPLRHRIMLDANIGIKPIFPIRNRNADVKPALSVGWGHLEMTHASETSDFLMMRLSCEVLFYATKKLAWVVETAIVFSAIGGNKHYPDAKIGPMVLLRAGAAFR